MRFLLLLLTILAFRSFAQQLPINLTDTSFIKLDSQFTDLSKKVLNKYHESNKEKYYNTLFRLQITSKQYNKSIVSLDSFCDVFKVNSPLTAKARAFHYRIYTTVKSLELERKIPYDELFNDVFKRMFDELTESGQVLASRYFDYDFKIVEAAFKTSLLKYKNRDSISYDDAREFCIAYNSYIVHKNVLVLGRKNLQIIENSKFIIEDSVLIKTRDGATLSATIIKKRSVPDPQPVIFNFTIYPGPGDREKAKTAANLGYVGVVVNTRGKRLSPQNIEPFEHDANDAYDILEWISHQHWCNGRVGMYGSSYLGFSQWASLKNLHPVLKTIVPQVSVGAGIDFPMQNNIFKSFMLKWIHYVSNNKLTDDAEVSKKNYWNSIYTKWYSSGKSFESMDEIEGRPSLLFKRWLTHSSYDKYWQDMVPYKKEFSNILIPVLTITGYYDDDQLGAMYYTREHYRFNRNANHYLLIGPYDHSGAQGIPSSDLNGYKIDPIANININNLIFKWFDYTLKDSLKPEILRDKINFEVMGDNQWRHSSSLDNISNDTLRFYLDNNRSGDYYKLNPQKNIINESINQEIDFKYRGDTTDIQSDGLISSTLDAGTSVLFVSDTLKSDIIISGSFFGQISNVINKKDYDLSIQLYTQLPDGKYFYLSNFLGRASYSKDPTLRHLLIPGKKELVPFSNSTFVSKKISAGSKLIVLVGVNKNKYWQVNYGTGKDVSSETIKDAEIPLKISWLNDSYVEIPIWRDK
ncbi:MAG TPA: CocE/NonD family hydrolase [Bacteroidia bacterium]|jgi:hypothetical protein|nr:CocE/NonD family hydrolase [Bacteroidia bacterium]